MKNTFGIALLVAALGIAPMASADNLACHGVLNDLLKTMRSAKPDKDKKEEAKRQEQLRRTEREVEEGRRKGVDDCELWRRVSTEVVGS